MLSADRFGQWRTCASSAQSRHAAAVLQKEPAKHGDKVEIKKTPVRISQTVVLVGITGLELIFFIFQAILGVLFTSNQPGFDTLKPAAFGAKYVPE